MSDIVHPHRRYNPLTDEWVLVSPQRSERPWLGQVEKLSPPSLSRYEPDCYLCPGNERAGGVRNPRYEGTFVFDNDFPVLLQDSPSGMQQENGLLRSASERGVCRVICFSPRHDVTLAEMSLPELGRVVDAWIDQTSTLGVLDFVNYVHIFENKGAAMGASNPHPHCQMWGTERIPNEPAKEQRAFATYTQEHRGCLLCDYLKLEGQMMERIILQNEHFVALVPYWAVWPFETMLLPRRHVGHLPDLSGDERDALADAVKRLTVRYDNLFETSFPYSMGFHQAPTDGAPHHGVHLHAHYYPPLLRSATVRKFLAGYEMLGEPQRDLTPEAAAERLRSLSEARFE